jgi:hypothetical protein
LVDRTLTAVVAPGSFFSGAERVAIAQTARDARVAGSSAPTLSAARTDATRRVAADASSIRPEMIDVWAAAGLERLAYVELVSVVVRLVAIDSYVAALGLPLTPLPTPPGSAAVAAIDPRAEMSGAWVPTVGRAGATTALSALPVEAAGVELLHGSLYLSYEQVGRLDEDPGKAISRPQMELIAARTSWLNECFY